MKEKIFYQINSSTCGVAALKSFLYHHSKGKINDIEEDINHDHYSLKELKDIAFKYGVITNGIELESINIDSIPTYSIVILNIDDVSHYVFYLYTKKKVVIFDPSLGRITLDQEEFLAYLSPYVLIFQSIEFNYVSKNKIDKKDVLLIILEFIQSIPLFLLFLSFSNEGYISFTLLLIYWFIYFIKRIILLKLMEKFDKSIEDKIKDNNINSIETIKALYLYKQHKFSFISNIYNFFSIKFVFIMFTLLIPYGFILTLGYILTLLIDYFSYSYLNKDIYKITNIENNKNDNYGKFKSLNCYTNKYAFKKEFLKLLAILVFLILIIIYSLSFNITYSLLSGIIISSIYIIINDDFSFINDKFKSYQINKTIYKNLK